jgi:hypothetical protein
VQAGYRWPVRQTRVTTAFLVAWLGLQLLLPIRGFLYDKLETRGNFSWNMYSRRYSCHAEYALRRPDGTEIPVDPDDFFRRSGPGKTYHRDVLPVFHAWLCETMRERGDAGTLLGEVACSRDNGPYRELVAENTRICEAPNFGVLER